MLLIFFGLIAFSIIDVDGQTNLDVGGIRAVRIAPGTSQYGNRDGVLEVNYNGQWGAVCTYGFDEIAASVACFMLGYPPRGVPILNSRRRSRLDIILSNFNCTGKVVLPNSEPSTATVHLGVCSFSHTPPASCASLERYVALLCLDPPSTTTTTTPVPNLATVSPVDCSNPSSSSVRLVDGSDRAGRVEIRHPETKEWGTICADGFGLNAAKAICRMLCASADNLQHAHPVLYRYASANDTLPIHLSRITCPEDASSVNDCDLGGGWGAVGGCTHGMDVGVQCEPALPTTLPSHYEPEFSCENTSAVVRYEKKANPDIIPAMIRLSEVPPPGCQFVVNETSTHVLAYVPMEGCGGTLALSNESMIALRLELTREYLAPQNGVIYNLPVKFTITCFIPRVNQVESRPLHSPRMTSKPLEGTRVISASIQLFSDALFTQQLAEPVSIPPGDMLHVLVSLQNAHLTSKLVLQNCWATAKQDPKSLPRQQLIVDRCASFERLDLVPMTNTAIGFMFPAFYLGNGGDVVPASSNLYLHCETNICDVRETSQQCQQFCRTPVIVRRMRRSLERLASSRPISVSDTPEAVHVAKGQVTVL